MNKNLIADIILYGSAIGIILWAILKSFGIINFPTWVEMLPYILGGSSILGISYKFGQFNKEFEILKNKVDKLMRLKERFNKLENEYNLYIQGKLNIH